MLTILFSVAAGMFVKDVTASWLLGLMAMILTSRVLKLTKKGLR